MSWDESFGECISEKRKGTKQDCWEQIKCVCGGGASAYTVGFPGGSVVKNPLANAGDAGSIPGPGGSPGEGNGNPLQYSCLGNPKDKDSSGL